MRDLYHKVESTAITNLSCRQIAGLVTIGPTFQPTIPLSIALNSKVDISTGFTLEVSWPKCQYTLIVKR